MLRRRRPTLRRGGGGARLGRHDGGGAKTLKDLINAGIELLMDKDARHERVINDAAELLREAGKLVEAKKLFTEAPPMRRRVLGDKDGRTLTSINNLALLLREKAAWSGRCSRRKRLRRERGRHNPETPPRSTIWRRASRRSSRCSGGVVPRVPRIEAARARQPPPRHAHLDQQPRDAAAVPRLA